MSGRSSSQAGVSALEVVVMAAILSVLMIMITESMSTLLGVRKEQRAQFHTADVTDRVARMIETDITYAARVFCATADDAAYLAAMQLPESFGNVPHRLPMRTDHGFFAPDDARPETGNVLLVARRGPRIRVQHDEKHSYVPQSIQFVVYAPFRDRGTLELMRWTSELVVNYWDLAQIEDPLAQADVITQLYHSGVGYAWDPLAPRADALWQLERGGTMTLLAPTEQLRGREDAVLSRPFRVRMMALAGNAEGGPHAVPAFAQPAGEFPGGFELKVDGSATGKLVLLRIVARSTQPGARDVGTVIQRLFHTEG